MLFIVPPVKGGNGPKCPSKNLPCEYLCSSLCSSLCKEVFYILPPLIW